MVSSNPAALSYCPRKVKGRNGVFLFFPQALKRRVYPLLYIGDAITVPF